MLDILYKLARPLLFRLDAETAHRLTLAMLSACPAMAPPSTPKELQTRIAGLEFANPVGLAAGMDKDAIAVRAWQALGFGFAELGTVTPRAQTGNPKPRIWRLQQHLALINRLGFPSQGMDSVMWRIARLRRQSQYDLRLGINIGPNKDTAPDKVPEDYAALARMLAPFAEFVVVNLSSPNTPGLRAFQSPERIREIRSALDSGKSEVPFFIKLSPDLTTAEIGPVCEAIVQAGFAGIVATNTTLARDEVGVSSDLQGGLSGAPLRDRARATIVAIRRVVGATVPIIGVGGIASAEDAYGHVRAGASLVELYTGLIYEGPGLIKAINSGLASLLRRDGFRSISEAVGVDA